MADAAQELVDRVLAVEEGEHRRAADAELLVEREEMRIVAVDLQAGAERLDGPLAVAGQEVGAGQVDIVLGLVELHLDRVAAELEPLADAPVAQGDAIAEVGVEQSREAVDLPSRRHLPQVAETLVPVPPPAGIDSELYGIGEFRAQGHRNTSRQTDGLCRGQRLNDSGIYIKAPVGSSM